jgi:hypothetical protein
MTTLADIGLIDERSFMCNSRCLFLIAWGINRGNILVTDFHWTLQYPPHPFIPLSVFINGAMCNINALDAIL